MKGFPGSVGNLLSFFRILEIYCPALEAPFRGHITPATCTDDRANIRRNTICTYGCVSGHYVSGGDPSLQCQMDGLWNGSVPHCRRKKFCVVDWKTK